MGTADLRRYTQIKPEETSTEYPWDNQKKISDILGVHPPFSAVNLSLKIMGTSNET